MGSIIEDLQNPESFPDKTKNIRVVQTHISAVFVGDEFVYKIKKPGVIQVFCIQVRIDLEFKLFRINFPEFPSSASQHSQKPFEVMAKFGL